MPCGAIVVAAVGRAHEAAAWALCERLRCCGLQAVLVEWSPSLPRQLVAACAAGAAAVWMVGRPEVERGWVAIVDRQGEQLHLPVEKALARALAASGSGPGCATAR